MGTVTSVIDGDSVSVIAGSGETLELRLAGINAPEADECHHDESRTYLGDLIDGMDISYQVLTTDQFGRSLTHVWVDDRHVNHAMVASGFAIATTPGNEDARGEALLDAETAAASGDLGIWADDACGNSEPLEQITIQDVRADPPGRDEEDLASESVTLLNRGDNDVELGGWVLRDESSRHRFEFPTGTTVSPGGTITVSSADQGWRPGGTPVWNNDGDLVLLLDRSGRIIDNHRY